MMEKKSYTELDVWKEARRLCYSIYILTASFPKDELYGLTNQLRRCAVSLPSNIAEGCGRNYSKDSIQFFYISRGSLYELETQIYIAFDLKFIDQTKLDEILRQIQVCRKLLNGFIKYYKTLSPKPTTGNKQPVTNDENYRTH